MDIQENKQREKSSLYPGVTWNDALEFARNAENLSSKQISYNSLANFYNLNSFQTKSFQAKLSAAKQFGFITTGDQVLQVTDMAKRLLYPTSEEEINRIKVKCFSSPPLYNKLIERFLNKALPTQGVLENILFNEHKIAKNAKEIAAICFLKSIEQLGFAQAGVFKMEIPEISQDKQQSFSQTNGPHAEVYIPTAPKTSVNEELNMKDYFKFELTLKNGKNALLYLPDNTEKEDAELIWDMLGVILKRKYGINT